MAENSAARFDWVHGPFKVKSKKGRTVFSYLATDAITGDPQKLTLVMLNDGRQTASAALAHGKFAKEVLTYKNDMLFPSASRRGPFKGKLIDLLKDMLKPDHIALVTRRRITGE